MKKALFFTIVLAFVLIFRTRGNAPCCDPAYGIDIVQFRNIPTVITKAKIVNKSAPIALLISGDGGWYGFEQNIANHLADFGIPTIGLDSRKYFWARKTPDETAKDIAGILGYYSKEWGQNRFLLIGYSLGAEIVPFIVTRLPEEMKLNVNSAVLLSPETSTDFEIHISNMLGMGNRQNIYNVENEILKMQSVPTLCIFGDGEKSPFPHILAKTNVKVAILPGDHHYKNNLTLIVKTMKDNKAF
jgi:type IV secretory pathway VirJ component